MVRLQKRPISVPEWYRRKHRSGESDLLPFYKIRHDFGDTKHHEVFYSAVATTRFLEYFTEVVTENLTGTARVVCSTARLAPGTVEVRAAGDTATIYRSGVDFTEDDRAGSIARIPGGSIPNGASVAVQFVAPPVTRTSLEKEAKPPTKFGYLLSIPSTTRPPAPDVRYLDPGVELGHRDIVHDAELQPSRQRAPGLSRASLVRLRDRRAARGGRGKPFGRHCAAVGFAAIHQRLRVGPGIRGRTGRNPEGDRLPAHVARRDLAPARRAARRRQLGRRRRPRGWLGREPAPVVRGHLYRCRPVVLPLRQTGTGSLSARLPPRHRALGLYKPISSSSPPAARWD